MRGKGWKCGAGQCEHHDCVEAMDVPGHPLSSLANAFLQEDNPNGHKGMPIYLPPSLPIHLSGFWGLMWRRNRPAGDTARTKHQREKKTTQARRDLDKPPADELRPSIKGPPTSAEDQLPSVEHQPPSGTGRFCTGFISPGETFAFGNPKAPTASASRASPCCVQSYEDCKSNCH